ncbi:MAG: sialate O-acetylesterase [Bacteroidia bacterium]|nr:MAG: sialate O-acetylesterase [Bacteroidia bacterium]
MKYGKWLMIMIFTVAADATACVKVSSLFSSDMVLQQNSIIDLFGEADTGERINIVLSWSDSQRVVIAGKTGYWETKIRTPSAGGPHTISFFANDTVILDNILTGEVWFASGQSNMEMALGDIPGSLEENEETFSGEVRFFNVPIQTSEVKQTYPPPGGRWKVCSPETSAEMSAIAFYFARRLHADLKVPVGIIIAAWGGTPAESWMAEDVLKSDSLFKPVYARWAKWRSSLSDDSTLYLTAMRKRESDSISGIKSPVPEIPQSIYMMRRLHRQPSVLYNGMVNPFLRITIKGVIWYQGTSNKEWHTEYEHLFMTLITSWRKAWKSDYLPFYYVQIAPFDYQVPEQAEGIREGQRRAMRLPGTGMVVTMDTGDSTNIHPADKKTPGERLARWALANTYGQYGLAFSGPLLKEYVTEKNTVRLSFLHSSGGLASSDGMPLRNFYLEDISGRFFPAEVCIDGETLLLSSPFVTHPVSVRYAGGNVYNVNFINKDSLPASPFRTHIDDTICTPRYFDASGGDDRNDGLSPLTAWRNIDTINTLKWSAGAEILLKCN